MTKDGENNFEIMNIEKFDDLIRVNQIDQIITDAEEEVMQGAVLIDAETAFEMLDQKYYG